MGKGIARKIDASTIRLVDENAREAVAYVPVGDEFVFSAAPKTNPRQFRMWWTLIGIVADALSSTKIAVEQALLEELHCVSIWFHPITGKMEITTKSVSPEVMSGDEFNDLFQRSVPLMASWLGNSPREVMDRFNEVLEGSRSYDRRNVARRRTPRASRSRTAPARERKGNAA